MDLNTIYQFTVEKPNGEQISLSHYKNKVLLIVNTATECGFTPQLKDLETLRAFFEDEDFEILAFPSNDFGGQEPLEGTAISNYCEVNYDAHYRIFNKIRVRGEHAHPLYKFLRDKKQNGFCKAAPKWNFHKYLIDKEGRVVDFFYPFVKPDAVRVKKRIQRLLSA